MSDQSNVLDPLVLLSDKDERQTTFLSNVYNPVMCAAAGFGLALFVNWGLRKPPFSGLQNHAAFSLAGGLLGTYLDSRRNEHLARRDAVLRHYVELHPDDFPPKERKKYADVLERWVPIR